MLGEILGAGASILGGILGRKSEYDKQKEFAQHGLEWKAADAERAGISKIFAMGAPTISYSPQSVGDMGLGDAGKAIGKGIEGQLGPGSTTGNKTAGLAYQIQRAQLDGLEIDNNIKRAELASKVQLATQAGTGGVGIDTVTGTADNLKLQNQRQTSVPGIPEISYGASPEVDLYRTKHGWAPQVPQNLQESFESDHISYLQWMLRNKILPYVNPKEYMPNMPERAGHYWVYSPILGEYIQVPRGGDAYGPTHHHKWEYMMDKLRR